MDLPAELRPAGAMDISLPNGAVVSLPVSRPRFRQWSGEMPRFDFGKKPIVDYKDEACFAELAILHMLEEAGWEGAWIETYGGIHYLRAMPQSWDLNDGHVSLPEEKEALLQKIWKTAGTKACFDVFAWKGDEVLFCEAKRAGKDNLTKAQLRFIEGALECGVRQESLLIVEWSSL